MTEPTLQHHEAQDETLSLANELAMLRQHKADDQAEAERDAYLHAAHQMHQSGGGFAAALAEAYMRADSTNSQILRTAFAHLFDRYSGLTPKVDA